MRGLPLLLVLAALGCGDGIDRIPGEGCQPACVTADLEEDTDVNRRSVCLDERREADPCLRMGLNPVCPEGLVLCDEGRPRCEGLVDVPYCGR